MKKNLRKMTRAFHWFSGLLIFGFILFWYLGFFRPDPYVMERYAPFSTGLLWILRIGVPLLIIYTIGLAWGMKTRRMSMANTITLMGSLLLCLIAGLVIIYSNYKKRLGQLSDFHPYLQLNPAPVPVVEPDQYNIFCLGGSTTEFLDSQGKGWPQRVQTIMNMKLGRNDIRVYNLGKQWYTTQHSLIYYETLLRNSDSDVILIMHTLNDLLQNADFCYFSRGSFRGDYGHFDGPVHRLVQSQGFFAFLCSVTHSMWYHIPRDTVRSTQFPGLDSFVRNLNTLADLTEKDGIPLVLMTQPNLYKETLTEKEHKALYMLRFEAIGPDKQWDSETVREGFRQYTEAIITVSEKRHLKLIDLEKSIPKNLEYFEDDVHYTDLAFEKIAEIISQSLIEQLQLK
jgi:lysophospholipase L1-like esterase